MGWQLNRPFFKRGHLQERPRRCFPLLHTHIGCARIYAWCDLRVLSGAKSRCGAQPIIYIGRFILAQRRRARYIWFKVRRHATSRRDEAIIILSWRNSICARARVFVYVCVCIFTSTWISVYACISRVCHIYSRTARIEALLFIIVLIIITAAPRDARALARDHQSCAADVKTSSSPPSRVPRVHTV